MATSLFGNNFSKIQLFDPNPDVGSRASAGRSIYLGMLARIAQSEYVPLPVNPSVKQMQYYVLARRCPFSLQSRRPLLMAAQIATRVHEEKGVLQFSARVWPEQGVVSHVCPTEGWKALVDTFDAQPDKVVAILEGGIVRLEFHMEPITIARINTPLHMAALTFGG